MQVLADTKIHLPDLQTQSMIAAVIRALDDRITLNNRINVEFEQTMRLTYDYWFTQFDFPGENGKPYRSSGGIMVYSPELKRDIPAAWKIKKLDDVISRSGTGLNPRDNFKLGNGDNYYVTIKNVENGKVILDDRCDKVDDDALVTIQKRSDLQIGDILFTSIQPVGVTYLIHENPSNWNINESVFTLRPNYEAATSEYLFMLLSSMEMKIYTSNSSAGSVHKGIRHSILKDFKLAYGNKKLIDDFSDLVRPMLRAVYQNDEESKALTQLRDWLLPMLMTGQVKVDI